MLPLRQIPPERLFAEEEAASGAYAELAAFYTEGRDAFAAVNAAWASDMAAVQAVMWERATSDPQPDVRFFLIGESVSQAMAHHFGPDNPSGNALDAIDGARAALRAAFAPEALDRLNSMLADHSHLASLPYPTAADATACAEERLAGRSLPELIAHRSAVAVSHLELAYATYDGGAGDVATAHHQAWSADWSAFEGYLLSAAEATGDAALITVKMRWDLAVSRVTSAALPTDLPSAIKQTRDGLMSVLGTVERERLRVRFAPLPN